MGKIILNGKEYGGSGGSGGHTIVDPDGTDMPQENKLQFTGAVSVSDDSVNGQTVVDVEGGGNYYLNTIYSTEEKKVGYWTDKKPLYQKTAYISNITISANSSTNVNISDYFSDVDSAVNFECCDENGNAIFPNVMVNSGLSPYSIGITIDKSADHITFTRGNGSSATISVCLTLWYTKTTDTADPNPQTGGVIYLPTIYSEEEREVGVWTDGKPLYQKTLVFTGTYSGASGSVPINISDLDTVFCANAWGIISTNAICTLPYVHSSTNNNGGFFISADKTTIGIRFASGLTLTKLVFTLQYTKTTDTAGSGTWTPSGANAVHYSFTEHIVGTWFGETLWEKTIAYVSSAGQADTDKVIDTSIRHGTNCYVVDLQGIQTYGYLRNNGTSPTPNATSDPEPLSQGTLYLPYYGGSSMNSAHIYLYSDGIHFKKRGGSANANSIILTVRYVKI